MKYIASLMLACAASLSTSFPLLADSAPVAEKKTGFEAGKGQFLLNGEPFVVKAAELHYPRIPRPYWEHRIQMCKALGMNTICLYVFWNAHEQTPGNFDFTGQNDLRHFIELCAKNDMKVILRPGPYVCAEWEMGGLPWWLLKKKDIRLREQDPYFMERVDKFQQAVAGQVADLTVADGGPVIMVQVENEYGSYGTDKPYVSAIRDMLRKNFGSDVTLFQCDWSSNFLNNGLDDLIWTINFGTGADIDRQFAPLREARPESPLMCSEYWSGWFDKWGAGHETRPAADMVKGIDDMLSRGISFSLYMTHGGTNWGHWAGANSPGYAPDVTSYDYDAPISESGEATPKYYGLRKTLAKYTGGKKLPKVPATVKPITIDEFELDMVAPLFPNLPEPIKDENIRTMEEYDQGFGSILYRTTLPALAEGTLLTVSDPHDYAQVFVDGRLIGTLDRRIGETELSLPAVPSGATLDILVEAMGRINFSRAIKDFKGITNNVTLTETREGRPFVCDLKGWQVYLLPDTEEFYNSMEYMPSGAFSAGEDGRLPLGVYRGAFYVDKPSDTFLDLSDWGKGLLYVNGHAIGRFWEIGPQQTLYMPGCWLRKGENEIIILDIVGPKKNAVRGLAKPVLYRLNLPASTSEPKARLNFDGLSPASAGRLKSGNGWQKILFNAPRAGRYVCLEAMSVQDNGGSASVAEIYILDKDGNRLPREEWKTSYVSSEKFTGNHTADKAYDLQESTYWSSDPAEKMPQSLVIDLGGNYELSGFEILPRMETDAPGAIKNYKVYVKDTPFAF